MVFGSHGIGQPCPIAMRAWREFLAFSARPAALTAWWDDLERLEGRRKTPAEPRINVDCSLLAVKHRVRWPRITGSEPCCSSVEARCPQATLSPAAAGVGDVCSSPVEPDWRRDSSSSHVDFLPRNGGFQPKRHGPPPGSAQLLF